MREGKAAERKEIRGEGAERKGSIRGELEQRKLRGKRTNSGLRKALSGKFI